MKISSRLDQRLFGFECEGVKDGQARNPLEVVYVAGDQGEAVRECGAGDQRITEGHLAKLAELDCLFQNVLRQRQNRGSSEERLKVLAFLLGQAMIAQHFDVADCGHRGCVLSNEFAQCSVGRLRGVAA